MGSFSKPKNKKSIWKHSILWISMIFDCNMIENAADLALGSPGCFPLIISWSLIENAPDPALSSSKLISFHFELKSNWECNRSYSCLVHDDIDFIENVSSSPRHSSILSCQQTSERSTFHRKTLRFDLPQGPALQNIYIYIYVCICIRTHSGWVKILFMYLIHGYKCVTISMFV